MPAPGAVRDDLPPTARPRNGHGLAVVIVLLAAIVAVAFGEALGRPFFGDDFLFLEKTRDRSWISLWKPDALAYHFYRPWSRELHFWWLQHIASARSWPFHLANFLLWLGVLAFYFAWVRRALGGHVAGIAVAAVASLEAWAVPVPWSSGSQDLWMLLAALACLTAFAHGRSLLAVLALSVALLSKETAATLPAVALLYAWLVTGLPLRRAILRSAPLWIVLIAWAAWHPMLGGRLWRPEAPQLAVLEFQPSRVALGSLLTLVNLEHLPRPISGWVNVVLHALPLATLSGLLVLWTSAKAPPEPVRASPRGRVIAFALGWMLLAWLPTLMPVVIWQPYYALMGTLGAWMILAAALTRDCRVAVAVVVALAVLRSARLDTPSREWASGWSQRWGALFIGQTHDFLMSRHPRLAPNTRLFFFGLPRGVALVSGPGDAPPLRFWYRDRSLSGSFYSNYRARAPREAGGTDLFFRYDSTAAWAEIVPGPEDIGAARRVNPLWERDHDILARVLAEGGDWGLAAREYVKLAGAESTRLEHAYNAGLSFETVGDSVAAARWYRHAASLPGADEQVLADSRRLAHHLETGPP